MKIKAKAEMGKAVKFVVSLGERCTFGGGNGKKFKFENLDGKNFTITNAGGVEFNHQIDKDNNYLMDDHKTSTIVCDWRITSLEGGKMEIYTNEGYYSIF